MFFKYFIKIPSKKLSLSRYEKLLQQIHLFSKQLRQQKIKGCSTKFLTAKNQNVQPKWLCNNQPARNLLHILKSFIQGQVPQPPLRGAPNFPMQIRMYSDCGNRGNKGGSGGGGGNKTHSCEEIKNGIEHKCNRGGGSGGGGGRGKVVCGQPVDPCKKMRGGGDPCKKQKSSSCGGGQESQEQRCKKLWEQKKGGGGRCR